MFTSARRWIGRGYERPLNAKQKTRDSVFTDLFTIPEYQLQMYQTLHPEDTTIQLSDLQTITHKSVIAGHQYNDLGFLARDRLMILVEAQSTWSPNILIRIMAYAVQSLMDYFELHAMSLYANAKVTCPKPELYVIYTGERKMQPRVLSFRELFFPSEASCDLDATVHFIYFDQDKVDIINQYIAFCKIFASQVKAYGYTREALESIIKICRSKNILETYIKHRETELMDIMTALFSQEYATEQYGMIREQKGRQEGRQEGRKEGRKEIVKQMFRLNMAMSTICEVTGFSEAEVNAIIHEASAEGDVH